MSVACTSASSSPSSQYTAPACSRVLLATENLGLLAFWLRGWSPTAAGSAYEHGPGKSSAPSSRSRWRTCCVAHSLDFSRRLMVLSKEGAGAEGAPTFAALRQHYLTLMDAVGQEEEGGDGRAPRM